MDDPISPPPVVGSAGNELPAYMSNGVVGLKVRDNPLTPGMALLTGSPESIQKEKSRLPHSLPIRSPVTSA